MLGWKNPEGLNDRRHCYLFYKKIRRSWKKWMRSDLGGIEEFWDEFNGFIII